MHDQAPATMAGELPIGATYAAARAVCACRTPARGCRKCANKTLPMDELKASTKGREWQKARGGRG